MPDVIWSLFVMGRNMGQLFAVLKGKRLAQQSLYLLRGIWISSEMGMRFECLLMCIYIYILYTFYIDNNYIIYIYIHIYAYAYIYIYMVLQN